jgi:hypothetical protein
MKYGVGQVEPLGERARREQEQHGQQRHELLLAEEAQLTRDQNRGGLDEARPGRGHPSQVQMDGDQGEEDRIQVLPQGDPEDADEGGR